VASSPAVATGRGAELGHLEPPFSSTPVEELLRLVAKAARAHQLYLPNNPIYRGAIDALRAGFVALWKETDEITLSIAETEVQWFGVSVTRETAKSTDNLAWLFYKDGVRELTIARGFEETEVVVFLEMIQRARKANADEDDLVTMLWEADFTYLKYRYVDVLSDGSGDGLSDGREMIPATAEQVHEATHEPVEPSRASSIVDMADFDATLYFLDEREIDYLQTEIAREYKADLRVKVASSLLDIFEAQADAKIREEVLADLQTAMVYLLTAGQYRGAARILREASVAAQRATSLTPDHQDQLARLADRLSTPEVLTQLIQTLDATTEAPSREELGDLFDQLRPSALSTICRWLGRIRSEQIRQPLATAAGRLASLHTNELVRVIQDPDREISDEAVRVAGIVKAQAAVPSLGRIVNDPDPARRLAVVQALAEIGSAGAMQSLERVLDDTDRDVRLTAARALTARAHRPALPKFDSIVKGRALRDADPTEKMVFFEGFGALCGDAGVPHLSALLNGKSFLGRREDAEIRACAAIALGRVGTPKAIEALQKSAGEREIIVRNAVGRALRGGPSSGMTS
jgi:hypothetical protein